jgi:transcriptional regulator with XRE-family HTH domain
MTLLQADVVASNLRRIMDVRFLSHAQLGKKSGVSAKTIGNILRPDPLVSGSTIGNIEKVARALNIEPWVLLIPGIPDELLLTDDLSRVVMCYLQTTDKGREALDRVCEMIQEK